MKTLQIAFRNIFRNKRRSLMTITAISVSAVSIILFGGFVFAVMYGLQTELVQKTGHIHIYKKGFFDYGSGNPLSYSIENYSDVIDSVMKDPQLKNRVKIVTPILKVYGIAGNFIADASKTFAGIGMIPTKREQMTKWNPYNFRTVIEKKLGLQDDDTEGGVIGYGMAQILQLCKALQLSECQEKVSDREGNTNQGSEDFSMLTSLDSKDFNKSTVDKRPRLDLLAATANGAPNVVNLYVNKAESQGVKELDDSFISMHLKLAQQLLYGGGEKGVTGIVLQLKNTKDIPFVTRRLENIFSAKHHDFEFIDFQMLNPMYGQIISMFKMMFTFFALVMGIIVLFTIVNTMSMNVMERVNEIGTLRAIGVRQEGVMYLFLAEGLILGTLSSTLGIVIAMFVALVINASGITWIPPNNVEPIFLTIQIVQNFAFLPIAWLGLILLSVISSFIPAKKSSRMNIVDALRHI